jgi:hypothetical protein
MAQLQQPSYAPLLTWMLIVMSSINVSIDWEAIKSECSMLDRLDDLMQFATDSGREDLADVLHKVYCDLEEHLQIQRRAKLAVVK